MSSHLYGVCPINSKNVYTVQRRVTCRCVSACVHRTAQHKIKSDSLHCDWLAPETWPTVTWRLL